MWLRRGTCRIWQKDRRAGPGLKHGVRVYSPALALIARNEIIGHRQSSICPEAQDTVDVIRRQIGRAVARRHKYIVIGSRRGAPATLPDSSSGCGFGRDVKHSCLLQRGGVVSKQPAAIYACDFPGALSAIRPKADVHRSIVKQERGPLV